MPIANVKNNKSLTKAEKVVQKTLGRPSRGFVKLRNACKAFRYSFYGKTVLDIGSSTGGFTQYALENGAAKVIAVEKGTNQMLPFLRQNPLIELHEKTDIFGFHPSNVPDTIVADVSFLSLREILSYAKNELSDSHTDFLVMLKPQFEAKSFQLTNGIVKNNKIRRDIIKDFEQWLKRNNFTVLKKRDNDLKGRNGNIERFYWLKSHC